MPIRFRKSVKIAPGTRLNLSSKGVSASVGAGGVRASTGKSNGCLYNLIAMPFVIIFKLFEILFKVIIAIFKFATATPERRKISLYAVGGIAVLSAGVTVFTMLLQALGIVSTTPPTPTIDLVAMQSTAQASALLSFTQTALAQPTLAQPTLTQPSATVASIFDLIPTTTAVPAIVSSPTNPPAPTAIQLPTNVPPPVIVVQPTVAAGGVCSCSGDTLNCGDFSSYTSANACFNYCISIGAGDIHRLDGNNDGSACDSLR